MILFLFILYCGSVGKESTCNAGDLGSVPGLGGSPGDGKGFPLQYSGLENSTDYTVHGVAKSRTWLSDFHYFAWGLLSFLNLWVDVFHQFWGSPIHFFFKYVFCPNFSLFFWNSNNNHLTLSQVSFTTCFTSPQPSHFVLQFRESLLPCLHFFFYVSGPYYVHPVNTSILILHFFISRMSNWFFLKVLFLCWHYSPFTHFVSLL